MPKLILELLQNFLTTKMQYVCICYWCYCLQFDVLLAVLDFVFLFSLFRLTVTNVIFCSYLFERSMQNVRIPVHKQLSIFCTVHSTPVSTIPINSEPVCLHAYSSQVRKCSRADTFSDPQSDIQPSIIWVLQDTVSWVIFLFYEFFQVLFVSEWLCELYVLCICIFFSWVLCCVIKCKFESCKINSSASFLQSDIYRLLLVDTVVFKQWESSKEVVKYQLIRIKEYLEQFFEKENIILDLYVTFVH